MTTLSIAIALIGFLPALILIFPRSRKINLDGFSSKGRWGVWRGDMNQKTIKSIQESIEFNRQSHKITKTIAL